MATEILRPNAAGDETSIGYQNPSSGAHWGKVDEASPDELTTYVRNNYVTYYQRDLYNLPAHSEGSGTINFIKVYFRCVGLGTGGYAKPSLKSNSTVTDGTEVSLSLYPTWTTFSEQWNTNPADSQAWEWADIDALQIGVSIKAANTSSGAICTQVYVEVDYTAGATEKTSSDSGSGTEASTQTATLTKAETGTGVEALLARILGLTETGAGVDVVAQAQAILGGAEVGSGADAYVSLEKTEAKASSDAGSGVEGTPVPTAALTGSESGAGIDAIIARLLASSDAGYGVEAAQLVGLLKELFATEEGQGIDALVVKRGVFAGGEGTKFFGGGHKPPHRAS